MPRKAAEPLPLVEMQLDLMELPEEPQAVEVVKRFVHTGKIAFKDEPRCEELVARLLMGEPVIRIARAMRMSPSTVRKAHRELDDGGKLGDLKGRVLKKFERLAETNADNLQVMAEDGMISAHDSSVLAGILLTNGVAGGGAQRMVVEHRHTHRVTVGAGAQVWSELAATGEPSVVDCAIAGKIVDALLVGSGSGSGSGSPNGSDLAVEAVPAGIERSGAVTQGGGSEFSPGADNPDTSSDAKIQAKAPSAD